MNVIDCKSYKPMILSPRLKEGYRTEGKCCQLVSCTSEYTQALAEKKQRARQAAGEEKHHDILLQRGVGSGDPVERGWQRKQVQST